MAELLARLRWLTTTDKVDWNGERFRAQQFLIAFCFAFASFPSRLVACLCACLYVVAVFILSNAILYEHVVPFDAPYTQRLTATSEALRGPVICATMLLPFRWIFGVVSRETGINQAKISSLGSIEQLEEFDRIRHGIIGRSLDSICIIGLTLGILSRNLWFTGSILFLSAITLDLSFSASFPVLSSTPFLSMFGYQWGIVTATFIALRFLGFRVGDSTVSSLEAKITNNTKVASFSLNFVPFVARVCLHVA